MQFNPSGHADWFSYALIGEPEGPPVYVENKDEILVKGKMDISINRVDGQINWKDSEGKLGGLEKGLGMGWLGEKPIICLQMETGDQYFALGEKTGPLLRNGAAFINWNTDAFAYHDGRDPLYTSIPFFLIFKSGRCYGLFVDNTAKSKVNFGASNHRMIQISLESGPLNVILIPGPGPKEVLSRYSKLTGTTPMPPDWALGLHQSRYSYRNEKEVLAIAQQYVERDIPLSSIHLDIHYMDGYKVFTENEKAFPNLKKTASTLLKQGIRLVAIQDPGIKVEDGYQPFETGKNENLYVQYPDGQPWEASVWPGKCCFPDFTNPSTRQWWTRLNMEWLRKTSISGLWNDMNEPATWGQDVPDLLEFDLEGRKGNHLEAHNIYGQLMAQSTRDALLLVKQNKERPFVLTRAGYAGIQRYAAVWTGDNVATTDHYFLGIRLLISLGMSGVPFSGVDIGGFAGDADATLFTRWISVGAFFPFFRIHTMIDSRPTEPWNFGESTEAICKNYIRLRYRLIPMLKSAFYQSHQSGTPIMEPFFWRQAGFEFQPNFQHQFYLGQNLLIIPAHPYQEAVLAQIPIGNWYHLFTGETFQNQNPIWISAPIHRLPVLVKASSILVTKDVPNQEKQATRPEYQIHLFWGNEDSIFEWYEDNGHSLEPQEAEKQLTEIHFSAGKNPEIKIRSLKGAMKGLMINQIFIWHFPGNSLSIRFPQKEGKISFVPTSYHWLDALPDFDPFEVKSESYCHQCLGAEVNLEVGHTEWTIKLEPG